MPISVYQWRSPLVTLNVIDIDARFFLEPTFPVLSVNSSGPSLTDTPRHPSSNFDLRTSKDLVLASRWHTFRAQWLSTLITVSQALHRTFPASSQKACYNTLDWAVAIFLLVGQQFERIDQVFTQTLWHRMHFENLCLAGTGTCLCHH